MLDPTVPWNELLHPFSQRNQLANVHQYQRHFACFNNQGFSSSETEWLHTQIHGCWVQVRLRIYVAPAELVLPIKQDRRFSPEFQIQVEVLSPQAITFQGKVHVFLLTEQQCNELTNGISADGSRMPRAIADVILDAAAGRPVQPSQDFLGTTTVPVNISFTQDVIQGLPANHAAKQHDVACFSNLEFSHPSTMRPVWTLFAMAAGPSPAQSDISCVLFKPPTISICRGVQQRNRATKLLGYGSPEDMYAEVEALGGEIYKTRGTGNRKKKKNGADNDRNAHTGTTSPQGSGGGDTAGASTSVAAAGMAAGGVGGRERAISDASGGSSAPIANVRSPVPTSAAALAPTGAHDISRILPHRPQPGAPQHAVPFPSNTPAATAPPVSSGPALTQPADPRLARVSPQGGMAGLAPRPMPPHPSSAAPQQAQPCTMHGIPAPQNPPPAPGPPPAPLPAPATAVENAGPFGNPLLMQSLPMDPEQFRQLMEEGKESLDDDPLMSSFLLFPDPPRDGAAGGPPRPAGAAMQHPQGMLSALRDASQEQVDQLRAVYASLEPRGGAPGAAAVPSGGTGAAPGVVASGPWAAAVGRPSQPGAGAPALGSPGSSSHPSAGPHYTRPECRPVRPDQVHMHGFPGAQLPGPSAAPHAVLQGLPPQGQQAQEPVPSAFTGFSIGDFGPNMGMEGFGEDGPPDFGEGGQGGAAPSFDGSLPLSLRLDNAAGPSAQPTALDRSRPTDPRAEWGGGLTAGRPTLPGDQGGADAYFGSRDREPRDRERSLPVEGRPDWRAHPGASTGAPHPTPMYGVSSQLPPGQALGSGAPQHTAPPLVTQRSDGATASSSRQANVFRDSSVESGAGGVPSAALAPSPLPGALSIEGGQWGPPGGSAGAAALAMQGDMSLGLADVPPPEDAAMEGPAGGSLYGAPRGSGQVDFELDLGLGEYVGAFGQGPPSLDMNGNFSFLESIGGGSSLGMDYDEEPGADAVFET